MGNSDEFNQATVRATSRRDLGARAIAVRYDRRVHRVVVCLNTGVEVAFKPRNAPGLEAATLDDLSVIEISPSGLGLHFPALDADFDWPTLLEGVLDARIAEAEQRLKEAQQEAAQQFEIARARAEQAEIRAKRASHAFQRVKWKLSKYQQSDSKSVDASADAS